MSLTKVSYSMINGPAVNIIDYGADATGITDSYNAFFAAYNSGAGIIIISLGDFKLGQTLKLDRAVIIQGSSSAGTRDLLPINTSLINFTGTGAAFELVGSDGNGTRNVHIKDLTIKGTAAGSCGVLVGNSPSPQGFATMSSVVNVQITGFSAVNACGLHLQYALNCYFRNVSCFWNYDGVKTKGINTTLTFESCWSTTNSNYGWLLDDDTNSAVFINCIAESSGKQGLYITGAVSACDFYSWHSEGNCQTSGVAPNVITTDGINAPIYISFYSGYFGDYVGAGYLVFDLVGVASIGFTNVTIPSYGPGFMQVDAATSNVEFTTFNKNTLTTSIVNNTLGQVTVNHVTSNPNGNTGPLATATPITIFTASSIGMYTVVARLIAGAGFADLYMATAKILFDGTTSSIIPDNGVSLALTLSGNNVQVTQSSGGPQSAGVNWSTTFQTLA